MDSDGESVGSKHDNLSDTPRDTNDQVPSTVERVPNDEAVPEARRRADVEAGKSKPRPASFGLNAPLPGVDEVVSSRELVEIYAARSGPLPPPDELERYDQILPGLANRIVRVHESYTIDVSAREDRLVDADISLAKDGQGWAAFFGLFCLVTSIVFFAVGNPLAGGCFLSMPVLLFIASFLPSGRGKSSRSED